MAEKTKTINKKEGKKKEEKVKIPKDSLYLVLNLVLAVVTMGLSAALASALMPDSYDAVKAALFMGLTIGSLVLFQVLLFLVKDTKKDKLRAVIVGLIYVTAMIFGFISAKSFSLFYISTMLILGGMALNQFLLISSEETKKGKITNILVGIVLLGLAGAILHDYPKDTEEIKMIAVVLFLFVSLKKVLFPTLKLEKIKLLLNILIKTHAIDVIVCLFAFMIAFSFILPSVEDKAGGTILTFWDSMWYCFTVITTIGFGDFAAVSTIGRVLTVVLGVYGIVVVAILTSVIVNFYNEVTAKEKAREFIE